MSIIFLAGFELWSNKPNDQNLSSLFAPRLPGTGIFFSDVERGC